MRKYQLWNFFLILVLCISTLTIPEIVGNNKSNNFRENNTQIPNSSSPSTNSFNCTQVNSLWTELPGTEDGLFNYIDMGFIQIHKDGNENVDNLLIYGKMGAVCLDSSGVEKWRFKTNDPVKLAGYFNNSNQDAVFLFTVSKTTPNIIKLNFSTGDIIKAFGIEQYTENKMYPIEKMEYIVPLEIVFIQNSLNLDVVYFLDNSLMIIDINTGEIKRQIKNPFTSSDPYDTMSPKAILSEDKKEIYCRYNYFDYEVNISKSAIYKLDLNDYTFSHIFTTDGEITDFFVETTNTKVICTRILDNDKYSIVVINCETKKSCKIIQNDNSVLIQQISKKKSNNFLTLELQEDPNKLNISLWKDSIESTSIVELEKSWSININATNTTHFNNEILIMEAMDHFLLLSQYCSHNHKEFYCEYRLSKNNASVVQNELFLGYSLCSIENEAFGKGRIIPLGSYLTNIAILTIYGNLYTFNHSNMSSKKIMGSPVSNFNQNDLLYMEINSELAIIAKKHAKFDNIVDYFVGMNKNDNKIYWKVVLQNDSLGSFGFRDIRIIPDLTNDGYPEIVCYSQQLNSNEIEDKDLAGESTQIFLISGSNGTILENIFWRNIVDGSPISPFIDSINHFNESSVIIQPRIINSSVFLCNFDLLTKELCIKFTNYSTIGIQSPYSLKEQKVLAISQSRKNDFYMIGKNQNDTEIIRKINDFNWESNYSWSETWDPEGLYNIIETTWELEIPEEISLETFDRTKHPQEIAKISFVEYNLTNNYPELLLTNATTEPYIDSIKLFIVDLILGEIVFSYEFQLNIGQQNYQILGNKLFSPIELFKRDFNKDGITDFVYFVKEQKPYSTYNVSIISGKNGSIINSFYSKMEILYTDYGVTSNVAFTQRNDSTILQYRVDLTPDNKISLIEEKPSGESSQDGTSYTLISSYGMSFGATHSYAITNVMVVLYENLNLDYYNTRSTENAGSLCVQINRNIFIFNYLKKVTEYSIFTGTMTFGSLKRFSAYYNNKLFFTASEGTMYSLDNTSSESINISVVQEQTKFTLLSIDGLQVHNIQFKKDGCIVTPVVGGYTPYSIDLPISLDCIELVIWVNGFGYIVNIPVEPIAVTSQQIFLIVTGIIIIAFIPFVIIRRKKKYQLFLEEFEVNKR